jgi:hypothetical protein
VDDGLSEVRVLRPVLSGALATSDGHFSLIATLNFEGATLDAGELAPGNWGEGFIDRRHPHTWVHELLVVAVTGSDSAPRPWALSLAAGKGFVAFGSDDPMNRPAVRYPVNHHLAQILERAIISAGARYGPAAVELTLFNGDEPERPTSWPNWERIGDSWAARVTLAPGAGAEAQVSYADVASPEHRGGVGPGQEKWSASVRWAGTLAGGAALALAEWARTDEVEGIFTFESALVEGEWRHGAWRPYGRLERTERPEEERTDPPFRSARPHLDNSILGITRWTTATAGLGWTAIRAGGLAVEPLAELSWSSVARVGQGFFVPADWYGGDELWSLTVGVSLRWDQGAHGWRMGRYGAVTSLAGPEHGPAVGGPDRHTSPE